MFLYLYIGFPQFVSGFIQINLFAKSEKRNGWTNPSENYSPTFPHEVNSTFRFSTIRWRHAGHLIKMEYFIWKKKVREDLSSFTIFNKITITLI